jgi:hypothetical protein
MACCAVLREVTSTGDNLADPTVLLKDYLQPVQAKRRDRSHIDRPVTTAVQRSRKSTCVGPPVRPTMVSNG